MDFDFSVNLLDNPAGYALADVSFRLPKLRLVRNVGSISAPNSMRVLVSHFAKNRVSMPAGAALAFFQPMGENTLSLAEELTLMEEKFGRDGVRADMYVMEPCEQMEVDAFWDDDDNLSFDVSNVKTGNQPRSLALLWQNCKCTG